MRKKVAQQKKIRTSAKSRIPRKSSAWKNPTVLSKKTGAARGSDNTRRTRSAWLKESAELREYIEIQEKINRGLKSFISEMSGVFRFIEYVSTVHSDDRILRFLMDIIKELFTYDAGALYLYQNDDKVFSSEPQVVIEPEEMKRYQKKLELDERIYNWVFRQGHAVIVPESFIRKGVKTKDHWSYMIAPLATDTERLGRVELLFKREQGTFTQQTFSLLTVLLKHAAVILVNERVYAKEKATAKKYLELDLLKQDIVTTTTHEIKTPLTIIQAASILLEKNQKISEEDRKPLLSKITHQCGRINQIINELFEASQIDDNQPRMKFASVSLAQISDEVLKDIQHNNKNIAIHVHFDSGLAEARVDRQSTYKILRNLIENAIKYSPQGGRITIESFNSEQCVVWKITDTGMGIPEEDQERIFDKFYRAENSAKHAVGGIGFGLYLVKKHTEFNHGKISVQSKLNAGSTFTLEFPRADQKA